MVKIAAVLALAGSAAAFAPSAKVCHSCLVLEMRTGMIDGKNRGDTSKDVGRIEDRVGQQAMVVTGGGTS